VELEAQLEEGGAHVKKAPVKQETAKVSQPAVQ